MSKFTGNTRYRVNIFGKVILQVEEIHTKWLYESCGSDQYEYTLWRDARVTDITNNITLKEEKPC